MYKIHEITKAFLPISIIAFIWAGTFYLARSGVANLPAPTGPFDLGVIISGAGFLAICLFSMLLGVFALFLPIIMENKTRDLVERMTREKTSSMEDEYRARSFSTLGYLIGENSLNSDFSVLDKERLKEAISYCESAYVLLRGTGLPVEFTVLNNLLAYSCGLSDKGRRGYLLEAARRLRAAAEEHEAPNLLLTYARTILTFSLDPDSINDACRIIHDVGDSARLTPKQIREVQQLTDLCKSFREGPKL